MLAGTLTRTRRSSPSSACPGTSTALSTSADRATWASVARLVSWSCRTEAGVGVNGLPAVGFTRTRVVLVYVAGIEPPYSQPARDPATSARMTTGR